MPQRLSSPLKNLRLFARAFASTKHEMWVSVKILLVITLVFAAVMYLAERSANPSFSFWDAIMYMFTKFVQDPAGIFESPMTLVGQVVGTLTGVVAVAIIAIPAGLVGSGLIDAMAEERREHELEECREQLHKSFRRTDNATLREYLDTLPDHGGERYKRLNLVPSRVSIDKIQARQHMNLKDILDTVEKFPEFEMKTMATAMSSDDNPTDRLIVEHFPMNRPYGCCINRGSKVTIVNPDGYLELGISQFSYYLAKFGGFNYVSKNVEVDCNESDSFFNMSKKPKYGFKTIDEYDENLKSDKTAIEIIQKKQDVRDAFLNDINACMDNVDNPWVVVMNWHIKNNSNTIDIHLQRSKKDGTKPTIADTATFDQLAQAIGNSLKQNANLETDIDNTRYPLKTNNLLYRIKERRGKDFNGFVLRPSSGLLCFNDSRTKVGYLLAEAIRTTLNAGDGLREDEVNDFAPGFGYDGHKFLGT